MFGREKLVNISAKHHERGNEVPFSKARRCLRTKLDSVFFAGPCTGGSPWNRINRWVSEATTQLIEAKKQIFWAMWEVFTSVLSELINMGSPALLELPRGFDYWKDRRMTDLDEGAVSHEHKFDGCMYGFKKLPNQSRSLGRL